MAHTRTHTPTPQSTLPFTVIDVNFTLGVHAPACEHAFGIISRSTAPDAWWGWGSACNSALCRRVLRQGDSRREREDNGTKTWID